MPNPFEKGPEREPKDKPCPDCQGRGKVKDNQGNEKTCTRCGGKGYILTRY